MPPSPQFVLETGLYARDLDAAERFYHGVLGLEVLLRERGRHVFFRCGTGTVLVFKPGVTQVDEATPHGSVGDGHVAFAVAADELRSWGRHFANNGIEVEHEEDWGEGERSLYVRDPAGNSVELATSTLWGTASRDDWLRQIRPRLDLDTSESRPVERFQNETLRPILKLLNPTILRLVAARLARYGVGFADMNRPDERDRLRNLLKEDNRLKQTLLGMVVGHLTADELETYLVHKGEIRRRTVPMLLARAQDQIDVIAEQVKDAKGGAPSSQSSST
jgi:catechol 2,3-dioxygenase-like lactoylglutathione lyase family enzyme